MIGRRLGWLFGENAPAGVDYSSLEQATAYDTMHQRFRRYDEEAAAIIERLGLGPKSTVIDMGGDRGLRGVCRETRQASVRGGCLQGDAGALSGEGQGGRSQKSDVPRARLSDLSS